MYVLFWKSVWIIFLIWKQKQISATWNSTFKVKFWSSNWTETERRFWNNILFHFNWKWFIILNVSYSYVPNMCGQFFLKKILFKGHKILLLLKSFKPKLTLVSLLFDSFVSFERISCDFEFVHQNLAKPFYDLHEISSALVMIRFRFLIPFI